MNGLTRKPFSNPSQNIGLRRVYINARIICLLIVFVLELFFCQRFVLSPPTLPPIFIGRYFLLSPSYFFLSPGYFLLSAQEKFVTKFVTCITKFVICVTKFLTCVTNFVTKTFLIGQEKLSCG